VNRFVARNDAGAIDLDARHAAGHRSGCDDDVPARAECPRIPFVDLHPTVTGQPRGSLDPVDLVLLEQELDPLRQPGDNPIFAVLHLGHVDADGQRPAGAGRVADRDAPLLRVLHDFERVGVFEESFGRDTAPQEAGASERLLFLDDGHLQAKLRRTNGSHVAAGAGADHDNVVFVGHFFNEERGTNAVGTLGRGSSSGSRRPVAASSLVTRAFTWPVSYRSSQ
jgi:hypothetical protein